MTFSTKPDGGAKPPWVCVGSPSSRVLSRAMIASILEQRRSLEERAIGDRRVNPWQVLEHRPARPDVQVPDLGVAHLPGGQPDRFARRVEPRMRELAPQPVEDRRVRELDGVARPRRSTAEAVEDDEGD